MFPEPATSAIGQPSSVLDLAIQGSAVPSERAFSSGGLTTTTCRNRLSGEIFETLQILQSRYQNGHICASEQAEAHFSTFVKELADLEVNSDMPALWLTF